MRYIEEGNYEEASKGIETVSEKFDYEITAAENNVSISMLGVNGSSASGEMVYKIDLFTIIECTPIGEEFERILVD